MPESYVNEGLFEHIFALIPQVTFEVVIYKTKSLQDVVKVYYYRKGEKYTFTSTEQGRTELFPATRNMKVTTILQKTV